MKIYAAGVFSNKMFQGLDEVRNGPEVKAKLSNILESYHYVARQIYVDEIRASGRTVFLDSGAFSASTLGITISVKRYSDWLKVNSDIVKRDDGVMMAACLDSIGDALGTYRNQLEMEAYGVVPMPTFHMGEDERYLEYYISKYPYINLGGLVGASQKQLQQWLERVWDKYLVDGSGRPKLKVHGFGITSFNLMEQFPWWSCDSSTWVQASLYGELMTPEWGRLIVSSKSNKLQHEGKHVDTMTEAEQEHIIGTLERQGWNYDLLGKDFYNRVPYNLNTYVLLEDKINKTKLSSFKAAVQELF